MILMLAISMAVFVFIDLFIIPKSAEDLVVSFVWDNTDKIEFSNNRLDLSNIDTYDSGSYFSVYDENFTLLEGNFPGRFRSEEVAFRSGELRCIDQDGIDYYIYDLQWDVGNYPLMLRGVINANAAHQSMVNVIIIALIWLILVICLGTVGANYISRSTFKPIKEINEQAALISGGDNLSERITLTTGSEEMNELATTFNDMFDRIEKSFESEKRFVSDASHELRTPTTIILAECARAKRKAKTPEDYQSALNTIEEQGNKMSHMISQLLSITRLDQGARQIKMKQADFGTFVIACCDEFIPSDTRGIKLETKIDKHVYLSFDPGLMSRVIQNLLENAYKYGRDNGSILVSLKQDGEYAYLRVMDNGIGISEEDQPNVFKRFWQSDASRGEDKGVGLGLAMVKQICELHEGSISLNSTPGEGSIFVVTLPIK